MAPRSPLISASLVLTLGVFALSACQQAAWKAGANADDLKRDEQTCRAQVHSNDEAAIKQCLRGKGWTVTEFSAPAEDEYAAPATAAPSATATGTEPSTKMTPARTAATPEKAAGSAAPAAVVSGSPAAGAIAIKRAPPDPMQRQSVQTWWKAGAQAADFNVDASACLEQLGVQHTPDYAQHLYTRAMVTCLHARGWLAGHDPVYTPLR